MTKKLQSTTNKLAPILALAVILGIWYALSLIHISEPTRH